MPSNFLSNFLQIFQIWNLSAYLFQCYVWYYGQNFVHVIICMWVHDLVCVLCSELVMYACIHVVLCTCAYMSCMYVCMLSHVYVLSSTHFRLSCVHM